MTEKIDYLALMLKDKWVGVRKSAVLVLGYLVNSRSVELLLTALDDDSIEVVTLAAISLLFLADQLNDKLIRERAVKTLTMLEFTGNEDVEDRYLELRNQSVIDSVDYLRRFRVEETLI
ncbi:MAG: HEAT repeat domain-containing protein, partial [Candidatus Hodarchaeales archaeon]